MGGAGRGGASCRSSRRPCGRRGPDRRRRPAGDLRRVPPGDGPRDVVPEALRGIAQRRSLSPAYVAAKLALLQTAWAESEVRHARGFFLGLAALGRDWSEQTVPTSGPHTPEPAGAQDVNATPPGLGTRPPGLSSRPPHSAAPPSPSSSARLTAAATSTEPPPRFGRTPGRWPPRRGGGARCSRRASRDCMRVCRRRCEGTRAVIRVRPRHDACEGGAPPCGYGPLSERGAVLVAIVGALALWSGEEGRCKLPIGYDGSKGAVCRGAEQA